MNKYKIYHHQLVNARIKLAESKQKSRFGGIIDTIQTGGDIVSGVLSFIPGLNLVGSGIDAVSSAVDVAQGDYGDAALRAGSAALGVVPGAGGVSKLAVGAARAAKAADTVSDVARAGRALDTATDVGKGVSATGRALDTATDVGKGVSATGRALDTATDANKAVNATPAPSLTSRIFDKVKDVARKTLQKGLRSKAGEPESTTTGESESTEDSAEDPYVSRMLDLNDPDTNNQVYRQDIALSGRSAINDPEPIRPSSYTMSSSSRRRPGMAVPVGTE
jgi:hypothetical protein